MALLDVFMQYFNMDTRYGAYSDKLEPCIIYIIQEEKIKSVANLFDGKLNKLLRYLLGDEYATCSTPIWSSKHGARTLTDTRAGHNGRQILFCISATL